MSKPRYSFVLPIFEEQELLPELFKRLSGLLGQLDGPAEVILVDDGSRDQTYPLLLDIHRQDPRFKVVHFSRNFGHQIAISAGMDYAQGEATIIMDADLQDPPEVVLKLIEKWKEGFEIVYAIRKDREGETWLKRKTASWFYQFLRKMTEMEMPAEVGDFRLVDRKALDAFRALRENGRYVRGMFSWIGFKQTGVTYTRHARFAGETKYPFRKMFKLAKDAVISFSNRPLRFVLNAGFAISAFSILAGVAAVIAKLSGVYVVRGWTSLAVFVCFLGGVQLLVIGILGEYVSRIYDEVKRRPLYLVRETHGLEATTKRETPLDRPQNRPTLTP